MKKTLLLVLMLACVILPQSKRAITIEDLWNMKRIESFDLSPDGKHIIFSYVQYNMDANKGNRDIYIINTDGTGLKPVIASDKNETAPRFMSNDKISYILDDQVFTCGIDGSEQKQITSIYSGVNDYTWSKDFKKLLFASSVYPDCYNDDCNKNKDDAEKNSKVKAKIFTELMFRHWNEWRGDKRSHLFLLDIASNKQIDLTKGSKADVPPIDLGSATDFNFAPDGNEVAFTTNLDKQIAFSTNNDIFTLNLLDENAKPVLISKSKGNDNQPIYSPDGKYLAFVSMKRAGFEADKQDIIIYNRANKTYKNLTEKWDYSVGQFKWSPKSDAIYFISDLEINKAIYKITVTAGKLEKLYSQHDNSSLIVDSNENLLFIQQRTNLPAEVFSYEQNNKSLTQITNINKELVAQLEMNPAETFWSVGANNVKVQSILVKPPFFDPNKKYPLVFLVHGGPQGNWSDEFHYRWNTQMFAAKGYVVVAVNPRGSTGYTQKFTDEISKDWGGKVYTDVMNAYEYALKNFKFIDTKNTFAAGASYGGYMMNWIEGHSDKFNAIVSHDGVFNLESMYGVTEEVWFPEWENGGTPWQNRKLYEKYSPHRYIQNAKTPMLIVQGALDFRVPEEQAFQLFTSLQRLGVESKLLYFPDEFHFVVKPQNARLWWNTIYDWFNSHLKK